MSMAKLKKLFSAALVCAFVAGTIALTGSLAEASEIPVEQEAAVSDVDQTENVLLVDDSETTDVAVQAGPVDEEGPAEPDPLSPEGDPDEVIEVTAAVSGEVTVEATGEASAEATGGVTVEATGEVTVEAGTEGSVEESTETTVAEIVTLTLDLAGGEWSNPAYADEAVMEFPVGEYVFFFIENDVATREGFTLDGWIDANDEIYAGGPITENIVVRANWVEAGEPTRPQDPEPSERGESTEVPPTRPLDPEPNERGETTEVPPTRPLDPEPNWRGEPTNPPVPSTGEQVGSLIPILLVVVGAALIVIRKLVRKPE